MLIRRLVPILAGLAAASIAHAQDHQHRPGMTHRPPADTLTTAGPQPATALTQPGQAAFGAIAEVVALLANDPSTDWSRVNLEALRQHLIDMDDVTLRSRVVAEAIPGGARFTVTGSGRTTAAIRRMARAHATMMMTEDPSQRVSVEDVAGGVRLAVTSAAGDPAAAARIRGLGFIGFMASGGHHQAHHLAIARGTSPAGHAHDN